MPPQTSCPEETARDVWKDGWEEAARCLRGWRDQWRLARERKTLHRLEAVLGELSWMQVDFSPASEGRVQAIHQAENEQVRLTNEMAEAAADYELLERTIRHKMTALEERARKCESARETSRQMLEQARQDLEAAEKELSAEDEEIGRIESLLAAGEKDLQTARSGAGALADSLAWRAGMMDRHRFLENALLGLRQERARKARRYVTAGNVGEAAQKKLADAASELQTVREELAGLARQLAGAGKDNKALKERLVRKRSAIDRQKSGTYQEVGAEFFDAGIFPRNQPDAYHDVADSRARLAELQERMEMSRQKAAAMPLAGRFMGVAYLVCGALCVLLLLVLLVLVAVSLVQRMLL